MENDLNYKTRLQTMKTDIKLRKLNPT